MNVAICYLFARYLNCKELTIFCIPGYRKLETGNRKLVTGNWKLVTGNW
jgi:hypothetical protein